MKILIAEDNLVFSLMMEHLLTFQGYDIVSNIDTGEHIFPEFESNKPDLLLLDIRLADKVSGLDAAKKIREVADTPIIFISAFADKKSLDQISGITDAKILSKPFDNTDLIELVNQVKEEYGLK